jgi:hypothetical protein
MPGNVLGPYPGKVAKQFKLWSDLLNVIHFDTDPIDIYTFRVGALADQYNPDVTSKTVTDPCQRDEPC